MQRSRPLSSRLRAAPSAAGLGVPEYRCCQQSVAGSKGCSPICIQFQMVPQCMHKGCPKPNSKHTSQELSRCRATGFIPSNERSVPNLYCSWCSTKAARDAGLVSADDLQTVTRSEWQMMFQLDINFHVPGFHASNGKEHVERLGRYAPAAASLRTLHEDYLTNLRSRFMGTQLAQLEIKLAEQGLWLISPTTPEVWLDIDPSSDQSLEVLRVADESVVSLGHMTQLARQSQISACQLKPGTQIWVQHMGKAVKATVDKNPLSLSREDEASLIGINLLSKFQQGNGTPYGIHEDSVTFVDRATICDGGAQTKLTSSSSSSSTTLPPRAAVPLSSTSPVVAESCPTALRVSWTIADSRVEVWPAVTHSKSIYEFVKVTLDSGGELECDAGLSLWKHERYIKDFVRPEMLLLHGPSSSAQNAAPPSSSKALGKRKLPACNTPTEKALTQAEALIDMLKEVKGMTTLTDGQRQPILSQCQRIMETLSAPGIKAEPQD